MDEAKPPPLPLETASLSAAEGVAGGPDLRPFADQLMMIAQQLRDGVFATVPPSKEGKHDRSVAAADGPPPDTRDHSDERRRYADMARQAYAIRRLRATIFGNPELFGEPAWDILLDLYIARAEGKPVSVSSACIGSAAPATTGLRWLGVLADNGLILREHDPDDQRRVLVRLTDKGQEAMDRYFASAAQRAASA